MKIQDPLAAIGDAPGLNDDIVVGQGNGHGKGKGGAEKSNGKGKGGNSADPLTKANLKSLTLWLSADGKSWRALDAEVLGLDNDKITARFGSKGSGTIDPATLGLPAVDLDSYYIGVSSSSTSFSGNAYSARLVSWQVSGKTDQSSTAVPEPSVWPLLGAGALGLGFALWRRKRA